MRSTGRSRLVWRVWLVVGVFLFVLARLETPLVIAGKDDRPNSPPSQNPLREMLDKLDDILDKLNNNAGGEQNHTLRWDRVLPAAQQFVILAEFNNQAVLDNETGLVWERSQDATLYTWSIARDPACANRIIGNRKGWRLPSFEELASLIDSSVPSPGPMLPAGHPFSNIQPAHYWSATANADVPTAAWSVAFHNGFVDSGAKINPLRAWCVRGGGPLSDY
jgi:hypothetical protein